MVIVKHGTINPFIDIHEMHSPTATLIGVGFLLVCFLLSSAMMTAIAETNAVVAKIISATMTAMVMTMLSGTVVELCSAESKTLIVNCAFQV